jgi:hypothetical protein
VYERIRDARIEHTASDARLLEHEERETQAEQNARLELVPRGR